MGQGGLAVGGKGGGGLCRVEGRDVADKIMRMGYVERGTCIGRIHF